jgi:hypothetical protein
MRQTSARAGTAGVAELQSLEGPGTHDLLGLTENDYGDLHYALHWQAPEAAPHRPAPQGPPSPLHTADGRIPTFRLHWRLWRHPEIA